MVNMSRKFTSKSIFIFDTSVFLRGISFNLFEGTLYTTSSIIKEIKVKRYKQKNRNILHRIHAAIESKKLIVQNPSHNSFKRVNKISKKTGDIKALSRADKELIALSLDLIENYGKKQVILLSNDYSMENVSDALKIPYSALGRKGIMSKIQWEVFCPFCNRIYGPEHLNETCEFCGERLKRRKKK
jgi:rRNA maturation endonuclease Nob1